MCQRCGTVLNEGMLCPLDLAWNLLSRHVGFKTYDIFILERLLESSALNAIRASIPPWELSLGTYMFKDLKNCHGRAHVRTFGALWGLGQSCRGTFFFSPLHCPSFALSLRELPLNSCSLPDVWCGTYWKHAHAWAFPRRFSSIPAHSKM